MLYLTLLILLIVVLFVILKAALHNAFLEKKRILDGLESEQAKLSEENDNLKIENDKLGGIAQETTALYDIAHDICKTLDEDKVFEVFKQGIRSYITLEDIRFVKTEAQLSQYANFTISPLNIEKGITAYLAVKGIKPQEQDKFNILTQQFQMGIKRALLYKKVQEMAITDALTQSFSRRYFLDRFEEEIQRSKKLKLKFSFLMIDIDNFKSFNDHYGHLVGDVILREIARIIKENIRQIDFIGRYGGEELSVILAETDKQHAYYAAERIRQAVESAGIRAYDEDLKVTISIGISSFPADAKDNESLIDKADKALYTAKQTGRNRVCLFGVSK